MPPMAAKPLRTLGVHSRVPPVRVSDEGQWFIAAGFRREEAGTGRTTRSRHARPRRAVPTTTWPRRSLNPNPPTDPSQEPEEREKAPEPNGFGRGTGKGEACPGPP